MDPKSQEIFNKITSLDERAKIFTDLAHSRIEIFCKGEKDEVFKLTCHSYGPANKMTCFFVKSDQFVPTSSSSLVCQFSLGGEKYFFKSTLDAQGENYILDTSGELFHLQRRQSYRIRIPTSTKSIADVTHLDTNKILKGIPFDLSTGGSKLAFNQPSIAWKANDKVKLTFKVGTREPLLLTGVVRHIQSETTPKICVYVGIQFENITTAVEKALFSITMELYREFFSRIEN